VTTAMVLRRTEGAGAPPPGVDPVMDAITQAGTVGALLDAVRAGKTPTPDQINLAEAALNGIENDLLQVQINGYQGSKQQPQQAAPGPGVWISGGATAAIAAGSMLLGGIGGFFIGKRDER
jgi:hypothetical protein